ncbi:putative secreted protein (Por secretion system target) [Lutibacter sp. Hel_I_33_5]|uniref:T9SS type A sorting domain-containing protein n=1 Tax=Lutibacter sp. Hel_I_33_5 TaxID=1566289 RepID=UPI0011A0EA59|nr:T9SS type A sorting domain-containing protein [Lutibacter sp. Hel_I_33_5]TVZ56164.1 putative secreted protein (Por secretion system target) [Lutibacter sp. Hel_I_33_5]
MKKVQLFLSLLFFTHCLFSQTNGWYQYSQPKKIYDMKYDSVGNLHCGTDMGYVKLDNTLKVVDFKNLTSQTFPVGKLEQIAINSSNNNLLYAITDRKNILEINLTTNEIKYPLFNETLEDFTNNNFDHTKIYWAKNGTLYIFGGSKKFYQTLENGVLSAKKDIDFIPTSIIENKDGTKVYFASATKGLWVLDFANDSWVNYTKDNSGLNNNGLTDLGLDANDVLYITSYGGLCSLNNGVFTKYEKLQPNSTLNYPCFQVDIHPNNNEVVVRTSTNNSASHQGFTRIELANNTWSIFKQDDTNCVNKNTMDHSIYNADGSKILAIESFQGFNLAKNMVFDYKNNTCSEIDFNYLDAENINSYSNFNTRPGKASGTIDVGFTNNKGFNILNVHIAPHQQQFANLTLPIPNPVSTFQYDVLTHKDKFLVTNNKKEIQKVDKDNSVTTIENFNAGSLIKTKKGGFSITEKAQFVYSEFVGSDRKIFYKECDFSENTCSESTEMFANDRNLTSNVTFSCQETSDTELVCGVIKKNNSGENAIKIIKLDKATRNGTPVLETLISEIVTNIVRDIAFLDDTRSDGVNNPKAHIISDNGERIASISQTSNEPVKFFYSADKNKDGEVDSLEEVDDKWVDDEIYDDAGVFFNSIVGIFRIHDDNLASNDALKHLRKRFGHYLAHEDGTVGNRIKNSNADEVLKTKNITGSEFNNLPSDFKIYKMVVIGYSNYKYATFMNTNYGLLFKPEIDYNSILNIEVEQLLTSKVSVHPNPTRNRVIISGVEVGELSLLDLNGRKIRVSKAKNLDISGVSKGVYLVHIKTKNNKNISKKIIVQ